jgi:hypothetical protein
MRSLTSAGATRNNREAGISINESEERAGLRVANGSIWREGVIRQIGANQTIGGETGCPVSLLIQ